MMVSSIREYILDAKIKDQKDVLKEEEKQSDAESSNYSQTDLKDA